ncbi:MAG TPA: helix-turn-helix domain-containing protein [Acidimicrobiales bacterium]|nr:helix-turn-helix domain-containing protein [Acidimicrobiales bacterium]
MPPSRPAAPTPRRRVGRPAQISRQAIAEAAYEVGLGNLTLTAVADHLGVSVAGLYHHIRGKDDLMRLAAEHTASRVEVPLDHGQPWAAWLSEWAAYTFDAFVAEPLLLDQFLAGAISAESIAGTTDAILGVLVRQGFTIGDAHAAYQATSSCALGNAVKAVREARARAGGRSDAAEQHRVLDQHGPDELPYLRRLLACLVAERPDGLGAGLTTTLAGIAATRDEPWQPVAGLVQEALAARRA